MFHMKRCASLCLTIVAAMLSVICVGCGSNSSNSSSSSSNNTGMSQVQAQAVAQQLSLAITQALIGTDPASAAAASGPRPSLSTAVSDLRPDASGGCSPAFSGQDCNFPISLIDLPCTGAQGGTISVTGDIEGALNSSGAGSLSGQFTITPANCSVSNLVVNGDPSVSVAGKINFGEDETPVFPVTFTETGGISYGPNPSGSCQLNATYTVNSSLSCTISGTVCGQSVSGSC